MTAIKRVTAGELFTLADQITKLGNRGSHVSGVTNPLTEALVKVLEAAKTAAFQEALEAHNREAMPQAGDGEKS
jgi:hypothetical protein